VIFVDQDKYLGKIIFPIKVIKEKGQLFRGLSRTPAESKFLLIWIIPNSHYLYRTGKGVRFLRTWFALPSHLVRTNFAPTSGSFIWWKFYGYLVFCLIICISWFQWNPYPRSNPFYYIFINVFLKNSALIPFCDSGDLVAEKSFQVRYHKMVTFWLKEWCIK